jgi:hypothetical protein
MEEQQAIAENPTPTMQDGLRRDGERWTIIPIDIDIGIGIGFLCETTITREVVVST